MTDLLLRPSASYGHYVTMWRLARVVQCDVMVTNFDDDDDIDDDNDNNNNK